MYFRIPGTSQVYFKLADVKASTNADDAVKNICTVKTAWKFEIAKKNWQFYRDYLWDAILHKYFSNVFNWAFQAPIIYPHPSYWWMNDILTWQRQLCWSQAHWV